MATYSTVNAIPTMTSDTTPRGIVISSGDNSTSYAKWMAFDKSVTTGWASNTTNTGWIGYDFGENISIYKYTLKPRDTIQGQMPKDWTFEGWNGTTWVVLDTRTNITGWLSTGDKKEFAISTPSKYSKYRLNITSSNNTSSVVIIGELEMYEVLTSNKILLLSNEKNYSIDVKLSKNEVPIMTSNSLPSGEVLSSSTNSTANEWRAFDRINTSWWQTATNIISNAWIRYKFVTPTVISAYSLSNDSVTLAPKDFKLQASNDGVNFVDLDSRVSIVDWQLNVKKKYEFNNKTPYLYYRLFVLANNGGTSIRVNDIELFSPTVAKAIELPLSSEQNFINYGMESPVQVDVIFTDKNYILTENDSKNTDGLLTTKLNRKPLSIKFN